MLTMVAVLKLVARSFSHVGGPYGVPTIVPLPVPPYLAAPPEARRPVAERSKPSRSRYSRLA